MASEGAASRRPPLPTPPPPPKRRVSWDQRPDDVLTYKRRRPSPPERRALGDQRPSDILTYQRRRRRATNSNSIATNSGTDPNSSTTQTSIVSALSSNPQQEVARHWISWRDTLEGLLQSLSVNQGSGGIQSCIRDALRYNDGRQPLQQLPLPVAQGDLANSHGEARESPSGPLHGQQDNGTLVPVGDGTVASLEANRAMCNNALFDILVSEKFALLCDSLTATCHINKPAEVIGLANIDVRMRNGDYAQNPKLFDRDIKQIWGEIEQIGRKVACLASSLSAISRSSYNKQASGLSEIDITEHKTEETHLVVAHEAQRESKEDSGHSAEQKEDPDAELAAETQESAVASREEDSEPDLSTTALSSLCKHCGTCEDEDKMFLLCGHPYCSYKFYHIRCLKESQIAKEMQKNRTCWYCPSCLCRGCFKNKDDEYTVLCDICDDAYHIYCMNPPHDSIPKGKWYCTQCSMPRATKSTMQVHS